MIPGHQPDKRLIVIKQPIGVTAASPLRNFPAAMITRKAGPALAAGCTMVLKPLRKLHSPHSLWLNWLSVPAFLLGIQRGVRQRRRHWQRVTSNPIVRKLSFTGSTEIGRH